MEIGNNKIMKYFAKLLQLFIILLSYAIPVSGQAAVPSFNVEIPQKSSSGQIPLSLIKVTVSLETDGPVAFQITNPHGVSVRFPLTGTLLPGAATTDNEDFCATPSCDPPTGAVAVDSAFVEPPAAGLSLIDPQRKRYVIWLQPTSDYDFGNSCSNTMNDSTESWVISVDTGSEITGSCLLSFDFDVPGNFCTLGAIPNPRLVPANDPVAEVLGFSTDVQACNEERPAVDVVLTLDKSGSMNNSTLGSSPISKIQALRLAVSDFIDVWDQLRVSEGAFTPADDQVGMVFFDATAHSMDDVGVPGWASIPDGLENFESRKNDILTHIGSLTAGGATSLGYGITSAADALFNGSNATNGHRKVILVMSNGKENTDLRVQVNDAVNPEIVQIYTGNNSSQAICLDDGNPDCIPLGHQDDLQIYSVTVGTSTAVSADINEDIATATGGFYINSENNEDLLRPFFLELLQNFVKFNTYEISRFISADGQVGDTYSTVLPVTPSTKNIAIALMWNPAHVVVQLTAIPPDGSNPIILRGTSGRIVMSPTLPLPPPSGEWQLQVTIQGGDISEKVPFNLVAMVDDPIIKTDLSITPADYIPGDKIHLQAKLTHFGKPILGLDADPNNQLLVKLVKPGAGIGDLLSESKANTRPPISEDPDLFTNADAKLFNELQANPDVLLRDSDTVVLRDNGDSSNGDQVAGDGIYSGVYPATIPGHYDFLFSIEASVDQSQGFSREQLKTVHVRSVPDAESTEITTNIDNNQLYINFTPRTKFGQHMGPGWQNYFWFTTSTGNSFKAQDNQNGTYSASLDFDGAVPPRVSLHFLRVSTNINDSATADELPLSLDEGTVLIDTLPGTGNITDTGGISWWWFVLILILLILFYLWVLRPQSTSP